MNLLIFYHYLVYRQVHIFVIQKSIVKSGCIFIFKNYIGIFIVKLFIYNQFKNFNFQFFIIHYKCPKKKNSAKMGIVIQNVTHFSMHSSIHVGPISQVNSKISINHIL
jgi:hypothetical protein